MVGQLIQLWLLLNLATDKYVNSEERADHLLQVPTFYHNRLEYEVGKIQRKRVKLHEIIVIQIM